MIHRETDTVFPEKPTDASQETIEELYEGYRDRLLKFVLPRVHSDRSTAEDIVQEAFAAALISFARFRSGSSAYTWLCSIAQHKISDHYRKLPPTQGQDAAAVELLPEENSHDNGNTSPIELWFETKETRDTVQQALGTLPPPYGDVLRFKYFDGLSVVAIGNEMGRSPKAVEGLLARARRSLSHSLSDAVHA